MLPDPSPAYEFGGLLDGGGGGTDDPGRWGGGGKSLTPTPYPPFEHRILDASPPDLATSIEVREPPTA